MNIERLLRGVYVVDIEATGLALDSRIHVMSCRYFDYDLMKWVTTSTHDIDQMGALFEDEDNIIVGHNFISYDSRVIKNNVKGLEIKAEIWDTFPLSTHLQDKRIKHGLESYGDDYGFPKEIVKAEEWEGLPLDTINYMRELQSKTNLTPQEKTKLDVIEQEFNIHRELMVKRCERDVLINQLLWTEQMETMLELYSEGEEQDRVDSITQVIRKYAFKEKTLVMQSENPLLIDVEFAQKSLDTLTAIYEEKRLNLEAEMPQTPIYTTRKPPAKPYKANGELSATGLKWKELMEELGLEFEYNEPVKVISGYKPPNSGSTDQIKNLLFSLGWEPKEYKFNPASGNEVPQINVDVDGVKELCQSIVKMIPENPVLENLNSMSVLEHRIGILKNFSGNNLKEQHLDENNYVKASWLGYTSTLRSKHRAPVN